MHFLTITSLLAGSVIGGFFPGDLPKGDIDPERAGPPKYPWYPDRLAWSLTIWSYEGGKPCANGYHKHGIIAHEDKCKNLGAKGDFFTSLKYAWWRDEDVDQGKHQEDYGESEGAIYSRDPTANRYAQVCAISNCSPAAIAKEHLPAWSQRYVSILSSKKPGDFC
jgi:hypothetical protein